MTPNTFNRRSALASLGLVYLLNIVFRDIHEFAKTDMGDDFHAGIEVAVFWLAWRWQALPTPQSNRQWGNV